MDYTGIGRGSRWYRRRVKSIFYNLYRVAAPDVFATLVEGVPWRVVDRVDDLYRMTCRFPFGAIELLTLQVTDIGQDQTVVRATWHQKGLQWYRWGRTRRRGRGRLEELMEHSFKQEPLVVDDEWPFAPLQNRAALVRYVPNIGYIHPWNKPVTCPHCGAIVAIDTGIGTRISTCQRCGGSFQHIN